MQNIEIFCRKTSDKDSQVSRSNIGWYSTFS